MNTKDYIKEGLRQLSDTNFYQELPRNPTQRTSTEIQRFLAFIKDRNLLPKEHIAFLTPKNPRTPLFYMLPKIHKPNNPGRPIVSTCDGPTENLSMYVDSFIKPLAQQVKSYIKDTNQFIQRLTELGQVPQNSYLVTVDVTSLYTSIPHKDGILAVKEALETRDHKQPLTWVLLRLLHLVLTKTAFKFYDRYYEQISGTSMGSVCAPSYAIIFMGNLEETFLRTQELQPLVWWRYIDDIFMIWPHSETELYSFLKALNQVNKSIKFTSDISQNKVNFLDVTIYKDNLGNLETGLYTKPTDAHLYLHYSSYHPEHQKKSIPYSQAIRLRRICSTQTKFWEAADQLYLNLTQRGYPKRTIRAAINRAFEIDRKSLLTPKQTNKKQNKIIPFTITYNPNNPPINRILSSNKRILTATGELQYLTDFQLLVVNKRAKNLRQILVRTDIKPGLAPKGSNPCNKPCTTCPYMKPTNSITCWTTKEVMPLKGHYNCQTKNVIYVISCQKCGLQYIGQTGNTFNERFRAHLTDIRQQNTVKPVSRHFTTNSHSVRDINAAILTTTTGNVNVRLRTEEALIYKFQSRSPSGLNLIQ